MLELIVSEKRVVAQREPDETEHLKRMATNSLLAALANYNDAVIKEKPGAHLRCVLELSDPEKCYYEWLVQQIREHVWGR